VKPQLGTQALPGQACSRVAGRENFGRTCSRVKRRETVCEAKAALVRRVAAEAEAGEIRAHALSSPSSREGKGSVKAPVQGEGGDEVGKTNQKEQRKEVAIWDMKERETLLTGATVVKVTWDALVLEKQGKHIIVEANCYQCGFGHFIVTVRE